VPSTDGHRAEARQASSPTDRLLTCDEPSTMSLSQSTDPYDVESTNVSLLNPPMRDQRRRSVSGIISSVSIHPSRPDFDNSLTTLPPSAKAQSSHRVPLAAPICCSTRMYRRGAWTTSDTGCLSRNAKRPLTWCERPFSWAEGVGFEPTVAMNHTRFRDGRIRPGYATPPEDAHVAKRRARPPV
jgi:hypothetical protein